MDVFFASVFSGAWTLLWLAVAVTLFIGVLFVLVRLGDWIGRVMFRRGIPLSRITPALVILSVLFVVSMGVVWMLMYFSDDIVRNGVWLVAGMLLGAALLRLFHGMFYMSLTEAIRHEEWAAGRTRMYG